ncbi:MAG: lysophospholipid acyltransferase family protein [bacterium]
MKTRSAGKISKLRAVIFQSLFMLLVILYAPLVIIMRAFVPLKTRIAVTHRWAGIVRKLLSSVAGIKLKVEGVENIPEKDAVIIFCKHQSTWETLMLQVVLPPYVWILKKELLRIPFFGWGLAALNPIAIDRKAGRKAMQQIRDQGLERIQSGLSVLIFPEGTRLKTGQKVRYKNGGAALAKHVKAHVLPIAHNGGIFWPAKQGVAKQGTATIRIGKLIQTEELTIEQINTVSKEWIDKNTEELEKSILDAGN